MAYEIVTVARFSNTAAAELARNGLERAGIRAACFQSDGFYSDLKVRLQVDAVDADRALAVLAETENHAKHHAKREEQTPREKAADRALFAAIIGMLLFPLLIYVVWQLAIVITSRDRLCRRMRHRAVAACVISVLDFSLFVFWVRTF
jgi:hypothetical protein